MRGEGNIPGSLLYWPLDIDENLLVTIMPEKLYYLIFFGACHVDAEQDNGAQERKGLEPKAAG
jgi:hypothetical protein